MANSVFAVALVALSLLTSLVFSQQPEAASPALRFDIARYQLEGNTLLKPADVARNVAPFTGKQNDFLVRFPPQFLARPRSFSRVLISSYCSRRDFRVSLPFK